MKDKILTGLLIISIAVIILLLNRNNNSSTNLVNAVNDTTTIFKLNNEWRARSKVIELDNRRQLDQIISQDSIITELRDLIKKEKLKRGTATIIKEKTELDLVIKDSVFNIDQWISGNYKMIDNDLDLRLEINSEVHLLIRQKRKGLFSKPFYEAEITQKNPYIKTTTIKTVRIQNTTNRKITIGPSLTLTLNSKGKIVPVVGIGVQYSLIRF